MLRNKQKFKKGATSIYVVVIATLLFSVVTVSFIRIIINETNKTTSDELAQAAYDSALAGVEDAKVALKQYYECVDADNAGGALEGDDLDRCNRVMDNLDKGFSSIDITDQSNPLYGYCDAVSQALGRGDAGEVLIKEEYDSTINEDHIVQAYTCVTVDNSLSDYRSTLGANDTIRVIPLKTDSPKDVTGIRISWYTEDDGPFNNLNYGNKNNFTSLSSSSTPTPPTLSAQIIQTDKTFTIGQFDNSSADGKTTNRGTVFLVPDSPVLNNPHTHVKKDIIVKSNNHDYGRADHNEPQKINCRSGQLSDSFACVASIALPDPVPNGSSDAERNADTFFLVLTLPYGQPTTTFSVQLCTDKTDSGADPRGDCKEGDNMSTADFKDVQIAVDSTGRANDMYSRVEARVEFRDIYFPFPEFAIQATGSEEDAIKKNFYVTDNCIKQDSSGQYGHCGTDTGPGN